jgi:hypothetical protein
VTRRRATGVAVAALLALQANVIARDGAASPPQAAGSRFERYHYSIAARIRPLLVFWLSRSGVGDAVVTRQHAPGETSYSLLIGSDPDRAPRRINRWGYIEEKIRGEEAQLVGLMTQSEEDSLEQAEGNVRRQAAGNHPFKVIQATVNGERASSLVTSIAAPEDYTIHQVQIVLDLALRESSERKPRVIRLPPGTRPGFLAALADAIHAPAASPIHFVYHGGLYELQQTHAQAIPNLRIAHASYGPATATDFVITSMQDGEQSRFSITYGTEEPFKEVPLIVRYQPRWWMQVELTLDADDGPAVSDRVGR